MYGAYIGMHGLPKVKAMDCNCATLDTSITFVTLATMMIHHRFQCPAESSAACRNEVASVGSKPKHDALAKPEGLTQLAADNIALALADPLSGTEPAEPLR